MASPTPPEYYDALNAIRTADPRNPRSMAEVGELLGVSHVTVSNWLAGKAIARRYWPIIRQVAGEKFDHESLLKWGTGDKLGYMLPPDDRRHEHSIAMTGDLRQWLEMWFEAKNLRVENVCKDIGYDRPDVLKDILAGKRRSIQLEKLAAIVRMTGIVLKFLPVEEHIKTKIAAVPAARFQTRQIPVIGIAAAQEIMELEGYVLEDNSEGLVTVPTDGYEWKAFRVIGDSMVPAYFPGDVVAGRVEESIGAGDKVVVKFLKPEIEDHTDPLDSSNYLIVVKYCRRVAGSVYHFDSLNPEGGENYEVPADRILWSMKIRQHLEI